MDLAIITLSHETALLAERIAQGLAEDQLTLFLPAGKYELMTTRPGYIHLSIEPFAARLRDLIRDIFLCYKGFIFIMPLGIVIRVIAPYLQDKYRDPAIVVIDPGGRYAISALSGHEGGANDLAYKVANAIHAEPIITSAREAQKDLIVGIGCCKGVSSQQIKEAVREALSTVGRDIKDVRLLATAELKAQEKGLIEAAAELAIPLRIISDKEIEGCVKNYNRSDWVKGKIGIEGVCEPSALLAGRKTRLILPKKTYQKIALAIAQEYFTW